MRMWGMAQNHLCGTGSCKPGLHVLGALAGAQPQQQDTVLEHAAVYVGSG